MNEFFVVVFGGDTYFQYKLSELLENSFNGIVSEEYAFKGIKFYFPILLENDSYYIYDQNSEWDFTVNGEKLKEKTPLNSGDYFKAQNGNIVLTMLVMNYSACSLSSIAYRLIPNQTIFIGRSEEMNIVLQGCRSISRKHASVRMDGNGTAFVDDLAGKTGVFVNGTKVSNRQLSNGDVIFIMGVSIYYFDGMIIVPSSAKANSLVKIDAFNTVSPGEQKENIQFIRTPRIRRTLNTEAIEIEPPTSPQRQKEMPFILTAGPSLTMAFAMLASLGVTISNALKGNGYTSIITSGVMAVSMLLGALLWPQLTRKYNKKQQEAAERNRQERYHKYLQNKESEIQNSYNRNYKIWNEAYPDCHELIDMVVKRDRHLWERGYKDDDFLTIRLGQGEKPFEVPIELKKKGFELEDDMLKDEAYKVADKYVNLINVPITFSLQNHKVVGVVGDYKDIAKEIITNLVVHYAPEELKIVLVYNRYQEKELRKFNDLPHMWSADKKIRYVATSVSEAHDLFAILDENIQAREELLNKDDFRTPYYMVLVFDQDMVEEVSLKKTLVDNSNHCGITSIFFGERFNQIPKECEAIIQKNNDTCGIYIKDENDNHFVKFENDSIYEEDIYRLVNSISHIEIKTEAASSTVPDRVSFLDMYQVGNVEALNIESRWATNGSNKSLAAPIGVMAGGKNFSLDIHEKYHGCHGLVAGTTGSGKSEFLQAYILSMMINYSPNEVAFVLVDFKGGDMARPFLSSPHLAATISNLSGNTLYRALVSLEAEVKNRQQIFNESAALLGIDKIDINSYQKYFKEHRLTKPLPHLVIVIDEFAQLKTQHPEFLSELVDVAQVGRSLGIHLILATQKPSGVVDPQIWSNSRFKVCLKVMDKQDSSDMINRPVAAMIKVPGRAYIQVGYDEIFELVQSGYSGADYIPQNDFVNEDSITVSLVNGIGEPVRKAKDINKGEKSDLTQLEAVMKKIALLGNKKQVYAKKLWLDPLPKQILLPEKPLEDESAFGMVVCGLMDLPHIQKQLPYSINFIKEGHLAIYGSAGTGKSTFVQTIMFAFARKYSPKEFQTFVIDFNGGSLISLSKMPHCVDYVTGDSEKNVMNIMNIISQIISDRREVFAKAGCANYESYLAAGYSEMPFILVVIDNYSSFREKMYKCEDVLVQNIAASSSCGIYFIITGSSKGAIYYKVLDHIKNKVIFNMNDSGSYRDIFNVRVPVFPENCKGRSLVIYAKTVAEMQVMVPFDAESEANRTKKINEFYDDLMSRYGKLTPYTLDEKNLVEDLIIDEPNEPIYQRKALEPVKTVDSEDAIILGTDINSKREIGFTLSDHPCIFVANQTDNEKIIPWLTSCVNDNAYKIYTHKEYSDISSDKFVAELDSFIYSYVEDDSKEDEIFIIDGFGDFYDEISDDTLKVFENKLRNGLKRTILTVDSMSRIAPYNSTELYLYLIKCKKGIFIGGKAENGLAIKLNNDFYMIYEGYRNVDLSENQAIVYDGSTASYTEMENLL